MAYNNKHKAVLQAIIHEGAVGKNDGKILINKIFGHDNTAQVISEINAELQPLNMTIKYISCEVTGQLYWILASTVQDTTARFHPKYSQVELALLRNVYSEIVTSNNGYVSSTWCLNLCSSLNPKLSKVNGEEFLQDMVEKNWLCYKDGQYYMGVRSIAELLQYFKDTYENGLHTCTLCKQVLFYGEKCNQCDTITHIHCLKTYRMGEGDLGCPNCYSILRLDSSGDNNNSTMDIDEADKTSQLSQKRKANKRK